ncbi:methylaspartate mutase subunit E [Candidatus Acetothermia bacterium]|nr:methylaspartate mutase subunit E [Candidatus Acetothermia bacterium]
METELSDQRLPEEEFLGMRKKVLSQWPTGQEVDIEEAISYHNKLPDKKNVAAVLMRAVSCGETLIQPRAGVTLLEDQIKLLRYLQDEGGADILPTTIDSYTRQNQYDAAQKGIEMSKNMGRSVLNGFPAVNYGVGACRRLVEELDRPLQIRHGTPDARLLAEISLAGGFTDFEGGGIGYNIPYAKDISLESTVTAWQYVDRLVGYYYEHGIAINRELYGTLTGTLIPPSISHVVGIIEGVLAAKQGVKFITFGCGQNGHFLQDIASIQTLQEIATDYLAQEGFPDVLVTTVFHQWMGGFPPDEARAFAVIAWGAVVAALAKANKIIVKTPHEAVGIPTKEANAQGLRATKQIVEMLKAQSIEQTKKMDIEKRMIRSEVKQMIDKVLEVGEGDWAKGAVRGFAAGIIDVPFAPSRYTRGTMLPARDSEGAIRFLDFGNLPFDQEVKEFHREKITARGKKEDREPNFQMVIDDVYAIGQGRLVGLPQAKRAAR